MVQVSSGSRRALGDTAFSAESGDAPAAGSREPGSPEPASIEALSLTSAPDASASPEAEPNTSSSVRPASLVGQTLGGRYLVTDLIGAGGMGAVYRAQHVQLQKPVALKVLNAEMALHKEAAQRFEREAMVSARIMHPHVVSANDSGRLPDGSLYLVLEFVQGRSLRQLIDEEQRLPPPRALAICGQIAEALAAAHAAEVVHR